MDSIPFHFSAFLLMGMHAIAMDTYPFIAAGAWVVDDVFTPRDRRSAEHEQRQLASGSGFEPALVRQTTVKKPACARPFAAR